MDDYLNRSAIKSLGTVFAQTSTSVTPANYPNELFLHYSLPAFDETGGPSLDRGAEIESNKTLLTKDCVLVSKLNPRKPRVQLVRKLKGIRQIASTEFIALYPRSPLADLEFFKHLLNSQLVQRRLDSVATGTTNSHVRARPGDLLRQEVFVPSPQVQQRIAEILDMLDRQIQKTDQVIAKLVLAGQGLTVDLLTRGVDANGRIRSSGAAGQLIDSAIGPIPRSWVVAPLDRFQTPERPYLKTGPFGSSLKREHWVDEGVPVVTIGSLGDGKFLESELLHVSDQTARSLSAYALDAGDIVFSR